MDVGFKWSKCNFLYYGFCDLVPSVQFKNVKNTHGGVFLIVKFTKSSLFPWVLFTFLKLYK